MGAPTPFFVVGPNTLVSMAGLMRGVDEPPPAGAGAVTVDVVIPAYNEEATIVPCLESLFRQTLKPARIVLLDDGSRDRTRELAEAYAVSRGVPLETMRAENSSGKTPGVKKSARTLMGDVLFVLDGDSLLLTPDYIERAVQALYEGPGVASACGGVLPLTFTHRGDWTGQPPLREFYAAHPGIPPVKQKGRFAAFRHGATNLYRDFLYFYLRSFIYRGQMALFGSIVNPIGCAVAYRRDYLLAVFDAYEDKLGDNLTTSEDIFIGFAFLERGYRNVQVDNIYVLSEEPFLNRLPKQVYLWSSSFLQSCYYFPDLVLSPFKVLRRRALRQEALGGGQAERRKIREPYRQAFGTPYTKHYGRPIGWSILFGLFEKISLPIAVLALAALGAWHLLALTLIIEITALLLLVTVLGIKHRRLDYIWKAVIATPVRYFIMMFDLAVFLSFLADVWLFRNFNWRK